MTAAVGDIRASEAQVYTPYRFVIAGLILMAHACIGLNFFGVTPLLPLVIDDYAITRASASLLVALPTLVKACIALPGSLIISRFGLNRVFTVSWFMLGSLALSPLIGDFHLMLALRLIYGIGAGLMMTATASLIMQWFRPSEVPVINTLLLIVISLGIAVSISLAVPLAENISWEGCIGHIWWHRFMRGHCLAHLRPHAIDTCTRRLVDVHVARSMECLSRSNDILVGGGRCLGIHQLCRGNQLAAHLPARIPRHES